MSDQYVTIVSPNDVLFGRGSGPNDHEGNNKFRELVAERKAEYMATNHRRTKVKIAKAIVDTVFACNGRFLKKLENSDLIKLGFQQGMDVYQVVDDDTVMEKAKRTLRQNCEKQQTSPKPVKHAKTRQTPKPIKQTTTKAKRALRQNREKQQTSPKPVKHAKTRQTPKPIKQTTTPLYPLPSGSRPDDPLPTGWTQVNHPQAGTFYFNKIIGKSVWDRSQVYDLLETGEFYAHAKNVLKVDSEDISQGATHWKGFIRPETNLDFKCRAMSKTMKLDKLYQKTREHAVEEDAEIVSSSASRSTPTPQTKQEIWHTDIIGNPNDKYVEGAHILPAGEIDHVDWYKVGGAALGLGDDSSVEDRLRGVRGCKGRSIKAGEKRNRFKHEGVLHQVSNRMYLENQKLHIDGDKPVMLIMPIRTRGQVVGWKGEGYTAIVLVGQPHSDTLLGNVVEEKEKEKKTAYKKSGLNRESTANSQEVNTACGLLREGVLALAEMIKSMTDDDLNSLSKVGHKKSADKLRTTRDNINESVVVPSLVNEELPEEVKVLKITFTAHEDNEGHPAPDPLLLLFKSANVWGRLVGVKFLANGEIPDPFGSEEHMMALEKYLDWHQSNLKNVSREELARVLGQQRNNLEV